MSKKIFLVACEVSGDLHGAHLISEIQKIAPDTAFCGVGGAKMQAAGWTYLSVGRAAVHGTAAALAA